MRHLIIAAAIVGMSAIHADATSSPNVNDPHWGCYDAQPGHPTDAEKTAFISAMASSAQAAERGGGPPAAGLLAMSALESGFGWTRTALFARNMFGWKFTGKNAAAGRSSWELACQPPADPNDRYIAFSDGAESLTYVAARLSSMDRYASITRRYHADRARGAPLDAAVNAWVRGIAAAGYNPFKNYPTQALSIANNYMHPAAAPATGFALYHFSADLGSAGASPEVVAPTPTGPRSESAQEAARFLHGTLERSRYMSVRCDPVPIMNWPDYQGRKVDRCAFSVTSAGKTLSALVYLLNPSEDNVIARIGDACRSIGLGDRPGCGRGLAELIVDQNGGQFPVAGFVIERKEDAGGQGADPVYLEFRDGCTVDTADHLNFTERPLTIDAMEHAARAKVASTRRIGRIANATRADYRRAGGNAPVGTSPSDDKQNRWLQAIRENELHAQDTGRDDLLRGVAIGMRPELDKD